MPKNQSLKSLEKKGRKDDTVLGHLTKGEIVLPKELSERKEIQTLLKEILKDSGLTLGKITVGHKENSINPETGYPEFFIHDKVKDFFKTFNPINLIKSGLEKIGQLFKGPQESAEAIKERKAAADEAAADKKELSRRSSSEEAARGRNLRGGRSLLRGGFLGFQENKTTLGS
jgi:hypothetical protein